MTDRYNGNDDLQRAEWADRLISEKIKTQQAIVESPVAFTFDRIWATKEVARWTHYSRILDRHELCGNGVSYCDNGGNSVKHPPYGCPDLEDLFVALASSGYEGFDEAWLHTCEVGE